MFGLGKKRKIAEAKKFADELAQAVAQDIESFVNEHVIPIRKTYVSTMLDNLAFDTNETQSPSDIGHESVGMMMEAWLEGAVPALQQAAEPLSAQFDENGLEDIADSIRQRLNKELDEQGFHLACDGIEGVREAIAAHNGEPPLNGAGMESIRDIVRAMGNPDAQIDWNAVFEGA